MTKPRPCFDDGSLTRVFKFPSRTHPKSTYYVTSSEVIIRIKKARKKWKLVVPKKRVVSYRTNRWFAKPRWIELELTFTQASRLGLNEARKRPPSVNGDAIADLQLTTATTGTSEAHVEAVAMTTQAIGVASEIESGHVAEVETDGLERQIDDDTSDFDLVLDLPDDVNDGILQHADLENGGPELPENPPQLVGIPSRASQSIPVRDAGRLAPRRSKKPHAAVLAAVLSLLLVAGVGAWLTLGTSSVSPIADAPTCSTSGTTALCADAIVTGATGISESLQANSAAPSAPPHMSMSPEPVVETTIVAGTTQEEAKVLLASPEILDGASEAQLGGRRAVEPTPPTIAATETTHPPSAVLALAQEYPPQVEPPDRSRCRELAADAQSMSIRFGYASPQLDRAVLTSLAAFAVRLQSCPSMMMSIEGHTDSDGHEERNETLSRRRAEAVMEYLVATGAKREQLSVIGYGQSRPYLPNVSSENKRRNRRAALVVEARR